jgi:hypothetical protein
MAAACSAGAARSVARGADGSFSRRLSRLEHDDSRGRGVRPAGLKHDDSRGRGVRPARLICRFPGEQEREKPWRAGSLLLLMLEESNIE